MEMDLAAHCRRVNIFNYLLDLKQVTKFAVAILQLDSSYSQQTSPKYRKMFRSIYTEQFKLVKNVKHLSLRLNLLGQLLVMVQLKLGKFLRMKFNPIPQRLFQ